MKKYFRKMKGDGAELKNTIPISEIIYSAIGSFLGIILLHFIVFDSVSHFIIQSDINYIIGSFGASAVLVYGAPNSPFAQPRNLVGGHIISALIGVLSYQLFFHTIFLAAAIAVSVSIAIMQITKTLHPPGGATALIAVIGSPQLHDIGYLYTLFPVARGTIVLLIVAIIINNISKNRQYPKYWF